MATARSWTGVAMTLAPSAAAAAPASSSLYCFSSSLSSVGGLSSSVPSSSSSSPRYSLVTSRASASSANDRRRSVRLSVRSPAFSSRRCLSRSRRGGLSCCFDCFFVFCLCFLWLRECFFFPCLVLTRGVCFSLRAAALRALSIARASARFVVSTSCVSASSASPTLISCDRPPTRLRFSASLLLLFGARSIGRSLVVFN